MGRKDERPRPLDGTRPEHNDRPEGAGVGAGSQDRKLDAAMLNALEAKYRRGVFIPQLFLEITPSVKAAVFLAQLRWRAERAQQRDATDGFVRFPQKKIILETGLSRDETDTARRELRERGLIEERYDRSTGGGREFRVRSERLLELALPLLDADVLLQQAAARLATGGGAENPHPTLRRTRTPHCGEPAPPSKERGRREKKQDSPPPPVRAVECQIPAVLGTPEFLAAWRGWLAYRRERKLRPWVASTVAAKLAELAKLGPEAAVAAIEFSIANGYQGIFQPRRWSGSPQGSQAHRQRLDELDRGAGAPRFEVGAKTRDGLLTWDGERWVPTERLAAGGEA